MVPNRAKLLAYNHCSETESHAATFPEAFLARDANPWKLSTYDQNIILANSSISVRFQIKLSLAKICLKLTENSEVIDNNSLKQF